MLLPRRGWKTYEGDIIIVRLQLIASNVNYVKYVQENRCKYMSMNTIIAKIPVVAVAYRALVATHSNFANFQSTLHIPNPIG